MDWVRSHHLTADSHQAANTHGGQLTDPIYLTQEKDQIWHFIPINIYQ